MEPPVSTFTILPVTFVIWAAHVNPWKQHHQIWHRCYTVSERPFPLVGGVSGLSVLRILRGGRFWSFVLSFVSWPPTSRSTSLSGGWRPPERLGGWILSVLERNHLRERAALRWQVPVPLQVPLTTEETVCRRWYTFIWTAQASHICYRSFYKMTSFL